MSTKQVLAAIAYVLAIVIPAGAVAVRFGLDATVDLSNTKASYEQLMSMCGAVLSGFALGAVTSRYLVDETAGLIQWTSRLLREFRPNGNHAIVR